VLAPGSCWKGSDTEQGLLGVKESIKANWSVSASSCGVNISIQDAIEMWGKKNYKKWYLNCYEAWIEPFSIISKSLLIRGKQRETQTQWKAVGSYRTHENLSWWKKSIMFAKQCEWKSFNMHQLQGPNVEKYEIKVVLGSSGGYSHSPPLREACLCSTESYTTRATRQVQLLKRWHVFLIMCTSESRAEMLQLSSLSQVICKIKIRYSFYYSVIRVITNLSA
jgi:hypothetical protein